MEWLLAIGDGCFTIKHEVYSATDSKTNKLRSLARLRWGHALKIARALIIELNENLLHIEKYILSRNKWPHRPHQEAVLRSKHAAN